VAANSSAAAGMLTAKILWKKIVFMGITLSCANGLRPSRLFFSSSELVEYRNSATLNRPLLFGLMSDAGSVP